MGNGYPAHETMRVRIWRNHACYCRSGDDEFTAAPCATFPFRKRIPRCSLLAAAGGAPRAPGPTHSRVFSSDRKPPAAGAAIHGCALQGSADLVRPLVEPKHQRPSRLATLVLAFSSCLHHGSEQASARLSPFPSLRFLRCTLVF